MNVNKPLNTIVRFYEKNPEVTKEFITKVKEESMKLADDSFEIASKQSSKSFEQLDNIKPSFAMRRLMIKFEQLAEKLEEPMEKFSDRLIAGAENMTPTESIKLAQESRAQIRRFFRKDTEANKLATEIMEGMKTPSVAEFMKQFGYTLTSMNPMDSHLAIGAQDIMRKFAPKEIKGALEQGFNHAKNIIEKPLNETCAEMISNIVKK